MIILFDVDGVLVQSRAYHLGLQKTIEFFARHMGLNEPHTLTQHEIDVFEANSITVEWESSAIAVAALLLERLKHKRISSAEVWEALPALAASPHSLPRPDFEALARRVGAATRPGQRPSLAALTAFSADGGAAHAALLDHLLGHCYDIDRSPTMQVVQNFVVGHRQYAESYGLTPHFEHANLLKTADVPLLNSATRERVLAQRSAGRLWFSIYTARPSLPPRDAPTVETRRGASPPAMPLRGYTPEAEAALNLCGFEEDVPVMAVGRLEWAAQRLGQHSGDLVKPSPVQPLAAIAAARTGKEVAALEAAIAVERGEPLPGLYRQCAGEHIHVFEDSASSLRAVTRAVELLNAHGLSLALTRHGIAPHDSPKHAGLAQIADVIHTDINHGLSQIL
jgi:hypothetical protein